MSRNSSRTLISAIATLVLAAAFPQASFANGNAGMWKINPAKSSMNLAGSAQGNTLTVDRKASPDATENSAESTVVVVHNGNVYLTAAATAKELLAGKRVSSYRMTQIGTDVRSTDRCGFHCQGGLSEKRRTVTFAAVAGQQTQYVLASNKK